MKYSKDLYNIFFLLNKKQRYKLSLVFLFCFLNIFFDLLGISMIIPIINIIIGNEIELLKEIDFIMFVIDNSTQKELLLYSIIFFLSFYLLKTVYSTFSIWYQKKFIFTTSREFSEKLLIKYFNLTYLDFINKKQSDLTRNIVFESGIFVTSIIQSLVDLTVEFILIIGISSLLVFYDPTSASILIFTVLLCGSSYILFVKKRLNLLGQKRQDLTSDILKVLNEAFMLQKEVRILRKENFIIKLFRNNATEIANINIIEQVISIFPKIWFELLAVIGLSAIVFYFIIFNIDISLLVPLLALYAAAIFRLLPCANRIIGALNNIIHNLPSFNVLYNELRSIKVSSQRSLDQDKKYEKFNQFILEKFDPININLKNISFSFDEKKNEKKLFENINITFKKGEITGLIGKTGSGKSTLANIVSGLIEEYEGSIEINNTSNFNINILMRSVGYVPQITNLLDDSIENNICFGINRKQISKEKLDKIIDEVELTELIENLKGGIKTIIGDQGLTLSGGQRQKIALARTLYLDPKIIIFDESTNSLDKLSEEQFFENIIKLKRDKIIICITHDMGLSKYFNKIYKISHQNIIEYGTNVI